MIDAYDDQADKHCIKYDESDTEKLKMTEEIWKYRDFDTVLKNDAELTPSTKLKSPATGETE